MSKNSVKNDLDLINKNLYDILNKANNIDCKNNTYLINNIQKNLKNIKKIIIKHLMHDNEIKKLFNQCVTRCECLQGKYYDTKIHIIYDHEYFEPLLLVAYIVNILLILICSILIIKLHFL